MPSCPPLAPTRASRRRPVIGWSAAAAALLAVAVAAPPAYAAAPVGQSAFSTGATRFGTVVQMRQGDTWGSALAREEDLYGRLGAVRQFQGEPGTWSAQRWSTSLGGRSGVISFTMPPDQVLAGVYDDDLRSFFASAPTDHPTWWSYIHEPDVAIVQGRLDSLAEYRAAFARIARLARSEGNPMLRTTVVLVGWTGLPQSHRSISDYWPGADLTDVVAWDIYNSWWTHQDSYGTLTAVAQARQTTLEAGKKWAIAEFGSVVLPGDDGSGRAGWIRAITSYAQDQGAEFVTYFDSNGGGGGADYRLMDGPSQRALRDAIDDQSP